MKRVISLLLVLAVVLGCVGFAACNGGDGGTVADNGGSEPANGNGNGDGNGESLTDILGHGTDIDSVSYVMEITAPGTPTITTQMWVERNKMRTEMTEQDETIVTLIDYDAGTMYVYMPDENMAIRMDFGQVTPPDYEDVQDIPAYDYTIIGTDTEDGKVCLVVEYSYGGDTVKSWIWKEHGFPVRVETTTAEGTTVIVYRDIDFGDIDDSMFELPPGVQIMEL